MRRSTWKPLLWRAVGFLLYLAGMILFLLVGIDVYLAPPERSFENLSTGHLPYLLTSVALIVIGRAIGATFGGGFDALSGAPGPFGNRKPEQSTLERLGYSVPSEPSDETDSEFAYEGGEAYPVCGECGTRNERGYSYCSNCSAELPTRE